MKLSEQTINLLKNFATINSNILIKKGKTLSTIAVAKNIMAEVDVAEDFPNEFGIFNLPEFLGVFGLLSSPDIKFSAKDLVLSEGKHKIQYVAADKSILVFPQKAITMPTPDVQFSLTSAHLAQVLRAAAALSVQDLAFVGNGKKVILSVLDKKNSTSNNYNIDLEVETDKTFTVYFKVENFKQLPDDYAVELSSKNISKFVGKAHKVTYYIAAEQDSKFEED